MAASALSQPVYANNQHTRSPTARNWTSAALQQSSGSGSSSPKSIRSVASTLQNAGVPQPTEDELNGRTYLAWLNSWDDAQVAKWLTDNRCGSHATTFANNDIRGNVLLDVDQQALKEMGVQSVGDRIKITVAVKKLRQACTAASVNQALASRRPLQHSVSTASLNSNGQNGSAPSSPIFPSSAGQAVVAHAQLARRVSNGKSAHRIPPPLHISATVVNDSRLPQAYQTTPASTSSGSITSSSSLGNVATYGARSSSNAAMLAAPASISNQTGILNGSSTRLTSSPRSGVSQQPALPPPRTQPPPPPGHQASSSRPTTSSSRQQLAAPTISTTAASPTSISAQASNWSNQPGDYGSLRKPRPAGGSNQYAHRKSGSTGGSISSMSGAQPYVNAPTQARPSTASASYQQQHASTSPSPTTDTFGSGSGSSSLHRPGTGGYKVSNGSLGLSPITEANSAAASPVSSEYPHHYSNPPPSSLRAQQQAQGYTVGKGGFARPTTAGGTVSISAASGAGQVIPLEDVLRKTVKFIGEDNISKMVNVDGARDTQEVLLRALKKFGKIAASSFPVSNPNRGRNEYGEPYAEMEGYGVFSGTSDGLSKSLTEGELWAICLSATRPERARGLILRRLHVTPSSPEDHRAAKARKLRNFFGEDLSKSAMSPTSPTNMLDISIPTTAVEPHSPTPSSPSSASEGGEEGAPRPPQKLRPQRHTMNRASTFSIMSGLNAGGGNMPGASQAQARSPSAGFIQCNHQKLRHFFGHRPPSELISSHLVDYFPTVPSEKKILSKAVRNNVRKSMMRRNSSFGGSIAGGSSGKTSWDASRDSQNLQGLGLSRFSVSTVGSTSRASMDTVPPLPTKDGVVLGSRFSEDYDTPTNRPALQSQASSTSVTPSIVLDSDEEDAADNQSFMSAATRRTTRRSRPSSRLSIWSTSKSAKDSDNASLLTVDEITEDLEKRRASRASWAVEHTADLAALGADTSGDSTESDAAASSNLGISDDTLGGDSTEDDTIEEEDEDEEDDDDDEEDEDAEEAEKDAAKAQTAVDPDAPQKVTTTTKKATFKWVRGALIGAGSFGQVYLGMNAINGSFMAVKQVELPTGNSHNEERKKSMLSALEREIELLKIIKHENIVQYLDSSSDGKHLYILLEYVPGGSVAHLLANYGAFEEALVRTFVKQILQGLSYLHENDIIHRDIKGANILVDNRGGIKISDFGISKKVEENLLTGGSRLNRPSLQGSVFWMAPEVVKQTSYTAKADIWSLGCLIVEMFTGHHPWFELTQMQAIFKIGVAKDPRPAIPEDFSAEGQSFLDLAFKTDYNERPTAAELLKLDFITQEYDPPASDDKE